MASMSKVDRLLAELAEEGGLSQEEREALAEEIKRRKSGIERRGGGGGEIERKHARGVAMYGEETPEEARERWMEQEMNDPEGVYGPGGATAGGIFGGGAIPMGDYDPMSHSRSAAQINQKVQAKMLTLLDKVLERVERMEAQQLPEPPRAREITGMTGVAKRLLRR